MNKAKACWNCEADVGHQATYCPFCGTDLLTSSVETSKASKTSAASQDEKFVHQTLQESLASLYKPPYSVRNRQGFGIPDEREEGLFKDEESKKPNPLFQSYKSVPVEDHVSDSSPVQNMEIGEEEVVVTRRGNILPLLFLMIGAHLSVLGILILFCSKDGVVTLEWSNRLWFLYCLIGAPLVYFGGRMLKPVNTF